MKAIKKVEVTPIDLNIGKIVDSTATTDDKTKNTYSMRIIDSKVDSKSDIGHTHTKSNITDFAHTHTKSDITDFEHNHDDRYYTETEIDSKFNNLVGVGIVTMLDGYITIPASSSLVEHIAYPTGFNGSNSVPIAVGISTTSEHVYGSYTGSGSLLQGLIGNYNLKMTSDDMELTVKNEVSSESKTINYKIILMKIRNT